MSFDIKTVVYRRGERDNAQGLRIQLQQDMMHGGVSGNAHVQDILGMDPNHLIFSGTVKSIRQRQTVFPGYGLMDEAVETIHKIGTHAFQTIGIFHVKRDPGDNVFTILDLWIHHGKGVHHFTGDQVAQISGYGCGADIDGHTKHA